jgi:type IV pilus assembly protein PilA
MQQPPYPPGPYQAPPPPAKKGLSGCAIAAIVALALGVLMVLVMIPLGLYGMRRYLAAAKTAEAKNTVSAISRAAVAAYERERMVGTTLVHRLCASATPVPAEVPPGRKYQPSSSDFESGSADAGWKCLKFALNEPIYYQYLYVKGAGSGKTGADANGFEISARGDLDGNGVTSFFGRGGQVRNGAVVVSSEIYIENEFE